MKKELCISAAEDAFKLRNPYSSVLVHSDAGSQYTSYAYKLIIGKHHAVQSISDAGSCCDNARTGKENHLQIRDDILQQKKNFNCKSRWLAPAVYREKSAAACAAA